MRTREELFATKKYIATDMFAMLLRTIYLNPFSDKGSQIETFYLIILDDYNPTPIKKNPPKHLNYLN